jgi:hypothetical protein
MSYNHICSLGTQCSSSSLIKELGLKLESYPFDWIFSKPSIVIDCLQTNFARLLDKSNYKQCVEEKRNIHKYYYTNELTMFQHHNPYRNKDHEYFVRCVNRFNALLQSPNKKLFVVTILDKQTYINAKNDELVHNVFDLDCSSVIELNNELKKHTTNYHIVCFKQTIKGYCSWKLTKFDNIDYIEMTTIDVNDGAQFINERDSKFFNFLLNKYYQFDILPLDIPTEQKCSETELKFINI